VLQVSYIFSGVCFKTMLVNIVIILF